jgi:hypothetical protein
VVKREDIVREIYRDYVPPGAVKDNEGECLQAAEFYMKGLFAEYEVADAQSITYPGFLPIPLDGAVQQVSWIVGSDGFAYTRASRNREELNVGPGFKERRLYDRIAAMIRDREEAAHPWGALRRKRA